MKYRVSFYMNGICFIEYVNADSRIDAYEQSRLLCPDATIVTIDRKIDYDKIYETR